MKILVIPSVMSRWSMAERIIKDNPADLVVMLGNYINPYLSTLNIRESTQYLRASLEQENRLHLIGHYDVNYLFPTNKIITSYTLCPIERYTIYNEIKKYIDKFTLYYYNEDSNIIFSATGVNDHLFNTKLNKEENFIEVLRQHTIAGFNAAAEKLSGYPVWWLERGMDGGRKQHGGLIGQLWTSARCLAEYNQIVSSTRNSIPGIKYYPDITKYLTFMINLNADRNSYAIVEDSKVDIYTLDTEGKEYKPYLNLLC